VKPSQCRQQIKEAVNIPTNRKFRTMKPVGTEPQSKITAFWDIVLCCIVEVDRRFIILVMEAVITSETSVFFY
jgi:hypothetical protein